MKVGIVAALVVGLGAPLASSPAVSAEPLLILPGAEYVALDMLLPKKPTITRYYTHAIDIGKGFFPTATPTIVEYPASIFLPGGIGHHIDAGAVNLDAAIKAVGGRVIAAGQSEGAVSINIEQARLQSDPNAPAADQVVFSVFSDPQRGILNTLFREGTRIPFIGITATPPVESRYDTVVITNEYDLWSDFPDRPWNVLALINAMIGATLTHARASDGPSDVPPENISVSVNSLGGTTTTYLVPAKQLPFTAPLRIVLPGKLVDAIDRAVRPAIDKAYSRNDAPGSTKPYLSHGVIRTGAQPTSATSVTAAATASPGSVQKARVNPGAATKTASRHEKASPPRNHRP